LTAAAQSPVTGPSSPEQGAAPAKALTAKQQQAYDLRMSGKTRAEGAEIMGISKPVYSKTLQAAYKKLGISHRNKGDTNSNAVEIRDPERAAAIVDAATQPEVELKFGKLREAFREAGLPPAASEAILRRLRVKFYGAVTAVKNLKTNEILDLLGQKIHLALSYMDDKAMAEASFRDLALGTTAMIEKRQLLRGEPTQIVSDAERAKLHELVPLLVQEAARRGITIDGQVTERSIGPA